MNELLAAVLADLAAEGDDLEKLVADLPAADWRRPTPAAGWDIASQVAHLAWTDEAAVLAATDARGWDVLVRDALADPDGHVDRVALAGGAVAPHELLARWRRARGHLHETLRRHPEGDRIPWFGPPMTAASMATARLMETWAHGLDVREALGVEPEPSARIRHVAHLGVRTRDFAFVVHGLEPPAAPFRVELDPPGGGDPWTWGPEDAEQAVRGPAHDFCLLVTQRVHRDDTALVALGPDAGTWLGIAQCFAGPPGPGRQPKGGA